MSDRTILIGIAVLVVLVAGIAALYLSAGGGLSQVVGAVVPVAAVAVVVYVLRRRAT